MLVIKEYAAEIISVENTSFANKVGNSDWRGIVKSIFWNNTYISSDCLSKIGTINHSGIITRTIRRDETENVARSEFVILVFILLYIGINKNARTIPKIIDIKIGFSKKKDKTESINKNRAALISFS